MPERGRAGVDQARRLRGRQIANDRLIRALEGLHLAPGRSCGTSSSSKARFRAALRIVRIRFAEARRACFSRSVPGFSLYRWLLSILSGGAEPSPPGRDAIANLIRGQIANYRLTKLRECARAAVCGARVADAHADSHRRPSISRRSNRRRGAAGRRKADSSIMVRCCRSRSAATALVTICIPSSCTYVSVG